MPCLSAENNKADGHHMRSTLPDKFRKIIEKCEENPDALFDAGLYYAISQIIDLLVSGCDGIHIYTMNNPVAVKRICDGIKNIV